MKNKSSFQKDYNDLAFVIDQTNLIDANIKQIITHYITPQKGKGKFVRDIVLNSSIVSLADKIKVFFNICSNISYGINAKTRHKFFEIARIRNAFAHNYMFNPSSIKISEKQNGNIKFNIDLVLEKVENSGQFETTTRIEASKKFKENLKEVKKILNEVTIEILKHKIYPDS
ncbi:MAG: hypothetical protein ABIG64_09035 [Candidatus Omnitrophota bacterium]